MAQEKGVVIKKERDGKGQLKSFTEDEWKTILKYSKGSFKNIENTNSGKEAVDAAIPAMLTLTIGEDEFEYSFDHGAPPKELKELVEYLNSFDL